MELWPLWVLLALAVGSTAKWWFARQPPAPPYVPPAEDWTSLQSERQRVWAEPREAGVPLRPAPMQPAAAARPFAPAMPPEFAWMPSDLVVLDLETAGFDRQRHQILQVGAVRLRRDAIAAASRLQLDVGMWLCQPDPGTRISAKITEITGLTRARLISDGVPRVQVIREVREFIGNAGVVAFNAPFDRAFLERDFAELGLPPAQRWYCAMQLAKEVLPGQPSYKLAALCELLQITNKKAHDAQSDAAATTTLVLALAPRAQRLPALV